MRRLCALGSLAALACIVGCASLDGLTADGPGALEQGDGGNEVPDASASDADPVAADGAEPDGGDGWSHGDAAGSEGGVAGDAASDATTDVGWTDAGSAETGTDAASETGVDARPPSYCSTLSPSPIFCTDFDEGPIGTGFNDVTPESSSTTARLTQDTAVSAPDSARFGLGSVSAWTESWAHVLGVPSVSSWAYTEFDLEIEALDPGIDISPVYFQVGNTGMYLMMFGNGSNASIQVIDDTANGFTLSPQRRITLQQWVHIEIDLDLANKWCTAKLTDAAGVHTIANAALSTSWSWGHPELWVGASGDPGTARSVLIDNVVMDGQ